MSDKIRVEFELNMDDVKELIEASIGEPISVEEIKKFTNDNPIKVSDILRENHVVQVTSLLAKNATKIVLESNTKLTPKIQPKIKSKIQLKGDPKIVGKAVVRVEPKVEPRAGTRIVQMSKDALTDKELDISIEKPLK